MQEGTITVGGELFPLPAPFVVLATQNPLEMEGTYPLPEAQLDRFLFKVVVPFPSNAELAAIGAATTGPPRPLPPRVLEPAEIVDAIGLVREVVVAPHVLDHAVRLVSATHPDRSPLADVRRFVRYGSSPRGLQALLLAAKVVALRAGRWHVASVDLARVAAPALRHRMILHYEAAAEAVTADRLVEAILAEVWSEG
jgi:MoxR-like ATPase